MVLDSSNGAAEAPGNLPVGFSGQDRGKNLFLLAGENLVDGNIFDGSFQVFLL